MMFSQFLASNEACKIHRLVLEHVSSLPGNGFSNRVVIELCNHRNKTIMVRDRFNQVDKNNIVFSEYQYLNDRITLQRDRLGACL